MLGLSSRLRVSVLVPLATSLLGAGCASAPPPEPVVVVVPTSAAPAGGPVKVAEETRDSSSAEAEVDLINARFRIVTPDGPEQSVELFPSGRVVKRVTEDQYEEDFYLKDVSRVEYVHEADWPDPHVARVFLRKDSITRWHRGEEEWTISTILHVSFVFAKKDAADDVVQAFRNLAKR